MAMAMSRAGRFARATARGVPLRGYAVATPRRIRAALAFGFRYLLGRHFGWPIVHVLAHAAHELLGNLGRRPSAARPGFEVGS
jgi:hypothetical protein